MGVWQRSPAGVAVALSNADLVASFRAALPDWRPSDVVGSPYCIQNYVVDDHLGGPRGLATARQALAARGIGLILDFVPNHVAPDHPWTATRPEIFVIGTDEQLDNDPAVVRAGSPDRVLARGRDPYFPAWPDVVQLNAFAPELRSLMVETLIDIADQCDGVRCDMAMLVMNDVFARTWGEAVGPEPAAEYWPTLIAEVRQTRPGFVFMAEAYWDLEWELQQQGFDYCYDKRLYDRLVQRTRRRRFAAPSGGPRLPARPGAVRREPRRTSGRARVRLFALAGGRCHRSHPDRDAADPPRSGRRMDGSPSGVPRPVSGRTDEPGGRAVLPDAPDGAGRAGLAARTVAAVRARPAGPETPDTTTWSRGAGQGDVRWLIVVNLSDMRGGRAGTQSRGPTFAVVAGPSSTRRSRCRLRPRRRRSGQRYVRRTGRLGLASLPHRAAHRRSAIVGAVAESSTRSHLPRWRLDRDPDLPDIAAIESASTGARAVGAGAVHLQLRRLQHECHDQRHQRGPGHDGAGCADRDHHLPARHGRSDDPRWQADRPLWPQAVASSSGWWSTG